MTRTLDQTRRWLVAGVLLVAPSYCLADKIHVGTAGAGGLVIDGTIVRIDGENLVIRVQGRDTSREVARIQRLEVDGEPAFTDAERAFALASVSGTSDADRKTNYEKAIDGYQKAVKSTSKPWVRDWSAMRLVDAADKTGRFDAAVTGWIALVQKDAELAAKFKPTLPAQPTSFLNTAAIEVQNAASDAKLNDAQRSQLLGFLLDVHRVRGDDNAAAKVAEQILKSGGDLSDPAAARAMAGVKLNLAKLALDKKDYDKAMEEVKSASALLVDAPQQADALYILAECAAGKLGTSTDKAQVQDVALAYMRVVAHFKSEPAASARVADALFKAAQLLERSDALTDATRAYQQVVDQYENSTHAPKARQAVARLKEKSEKAS